MFYSKYSDFAPDQIIDEKYQEDCTKLLNEVTDDENRKKVESVLYEGGYENFSVNSKLQMKNDPYMEREKRLEIASNIVDNPETFDKLIKGSIDLYHGTNINALPSILKYGMNSVDELTRKGIEVSTGEQWSRSEGKRNFISFTDNLKVAKEYSLIRPKNNKEKQSFGIILGISSNDIPRDRIKNVNSELPEIGIIDNLSIENIRFIAVPSSKVEFVKRLVGDKNIDIGVLNFEQENNKEESNIEEKTFGKDELLDMTKKRNKSGIMNLYNKIKEFLYKDKNKEGKNYGENSRE